MTLRPAQYRAQLPVAGFLVLALLLGFQSIARADSYDVPNWQPRTNGEYALLQSPGSPGTNLDLFDLQTGETSTAVSIERQNGTAEINGPWVAWSENDNRVNQFRCSSNIVAQNIESGETITIAERLIAPTGPRISGNLVGWVALVGPCPSEDGNIPVPDESSVTVVDLETLETVAILGPFPGQVTSLAIDGDDIIWLHRPCSGVAFRVISCTPGSAQMNLPLRLAARWRRRMTFPARPPSTSMA